MKVQGEIKVKESNKSKVKNNDFSFLCLKSLQTEKKKKKFKQVMRLPYFKYLYRIGHFDNDHPIIFVVTPSHVLRKQN